MQLKNVGGPAAPVRKIPRLLRKDVGEYERTCAAIIKVLEKLGGYEPAIDDIHVTVIARITIYLKRIESFVDSAQATEDTYSSVTDSQLKMAKMIQNAITQLALNRSDRIRNQTQAGLESELREKLEWVLKNGEP